MRPLRSLIAGGVIALVTAATFVPAPAWAGKKAHATAPAEPSSSLSEGRRLMADGNFAEACPKLAESQAQSPAPLTAMTLALCYEKSGKLASALSAYKTASDEAASGHQQKLVAAAQHGAAQIEPRVSRLTIKLPQGRGPGMEVRRDGQIVADTDLGTAIPVDAGGHDVEVTAPGRRTWTSHMVVAESGQNALVEVPKLQDDGPVKVASPAASAPPEPPPDASPPGHAQRIAGIVIGGVGVAGLALGVVAWLEASSNYHSALAACGGTTACPPGSSGLALRNNAETWATVADVGVIGGLVAIAGGVAVYFAAPKSKAAVTTMGLAPAARGTGLSLVGRF